MYPNYLVPHTPLSSWDFRR